MHEYDDAALDMGRRTKLLIPRKWSSSLWDYEDAA
jgi:hypothetical protein